MSWGGSSRNKITTNNFMFLDHCTKKTLKIDFNGHDNKPCETIMVFCIIHKALIIL